MTRTSGLSPTREGLLHDRWGGTQERFHDEAKRTSTESDRRIDDFGLHNDSSNRSNLGRWARRLFGRYSASEQAYNDRKETGRGSLAGKGKRKGYCSRYRICFITFGVLLVLFLILSGSGVFWIYNTLPKDGVSAAQRCSNAHTDALCSNRHRGILLPEVAPSCHGRKATRRLRPWCRR